MKQHKDGTKRGQWRNMGEHRHGAQNRLVIGKILAGTESELQAKSFLSNISPNQLKTI